MDYRTNGRGYENSGAWRFPGGSSTEAFYTPLAYDPEFLKKVAQVPGTKGLLDKETEDKKSKFDGLLSGFTNELSGGGPDANNGTQGSVSGTTGIGIGGLTDAINANAMSQAGAAALGKGGSGLMAAMQSPIGLAMSAINGVGAYNNAVDASNAAVLGIANNSNDPIGALAAMQGWTTVDPAYAAAIFGGDSVGSGVSQGAIDAANSTNDPIGALAAIEGWGGGAGGGYTGGDGGASTGTSPGGGPGDGAGVAGSGWANGGKVTKDRLIGPDPKGKDDGFGALDHGEYVLKADTVKKLGMKALKALNEGRATIVMKGK